MLRLNFEAVRHAQAAPVSPWQMKLGIRRELGLYADSIANYGVAPEHHLSARLCEYSECAASCASTRFVIAGARYYFYAWELPIFVAIGCGGGLSGALWIRINIAMTRVRAQYVPARCVRKRLAEVTAGSPPPALACHFKLHIWMS